jgi:hypothetical protein
VEEDNVLVLNNFISEMELDYLYCGNKRYIKFCKKLYSVDIDKWSKYFWKLYLTDVLTNEKVEFPLYIMNPMSSHTLIINELYSSE